MVVMLMKALVAAAVIAGVLSEGMETQPGQLVWLWRRPWLLVKSVAAVLVVVPALVTAAVLLLPLPKVVEAALVLLAISPAPPLLMKTARAEGGDRDYAASLQLVLALLATASLPGTLWLLGQVFRAKAYVAPQEVAGVVARMLLIPLALSLLVRRWKPELAARLAGPLGKFSLWSLLLVGILLVTLGWKIVAGIGIWGVAAAAGMTWAAVAVGYLMGGPKRETRRTLGVFCSIRHAGLAVLIATHNFPQHHVAQSVVGCVVVTVLARIVTQVILRKR